MNKKLIIVSLVLAVSVIIIGVSFAFFNYTRTGINNTVITGNIYFNYTDDNDGVSLTTVFPETPSEARDALRHEEGTITDNTFTFSIEGTNEYSKDLNYAIQLVEGDAINNKRRLDGSHLMFDLIEIGENNSETYLVKARSFANLNSPTLYVGSIPSSGDIDKTYKIRVWVSDELLISDTVLDSDYKETGTYAFSNHYASVKAKVVADFSITKGNDLYQMMNTNPTLDTSIDFSKASTYTNNGNTITNGQGIYKRSGTENDDYPILYYRGNVNNNNVYFAGFCWKIVRTTETGGIKLIYNGTRSGGTSDNPQCNNTSYAATRIGGTAQFNTRHQSPAYVGYMFGTPYEWASGEPVANAVFGNSFTYRNGVYILKNTKVGPDATHHYTCNLTDASGSCSEIRYYYYYNATYSNANYRYMYVPLTSGKSIEDALNEMQVNTTDSNAKSRIDSWYLTNLNAYTDKLEDTIWCNDRSISDYGGWNPNGGGLTSYLYFNGQKRRDTTHVPSLTCTNQNDAFTVRNSKGNRKLNYPVALLTSDEIMLAGGQAVANSNYYLYVGNNDAYAWSLSPRTFDIYYAYEFYVNSTGGLGDYRVTSSYGLRPSVSLRPGTMYLNNGADGTINKPYIVS